MAALQQPNFLIIVADDLGFSDTQPYGSEISTPNLQWLADTGLRMTDFHTAPTCSPTRSMLLSGTDNHIAGLGAMWEQMRRHPHVYNGKRGYEGYLNFDVAALPEVLADAGYYTVMSGKWHLGLKKEVAPCSRGFKKSFAYLAGAANHFNHEPQLEDFDKDGIPRLPAMVGGNAGLWMEDDHFLDRTKDLPSDFYSSKTFTDKLIEYLQLRTEEERQCPFFAYLPFTAPHWPLQAPRAAIDKYKGSYDDGPEALQQQRLKSLQRAGLIAQDVEPAPIIQMQTKPWHKMNETERVRSSRAMEIYAAMVDTMDLHIGRIFDFLRSSNEIENTFILFMSDNGAEGQVMEAFPVLNGMSLAEVVKKYCNNALENMGNRDSHVWYGPSWASAATAPSRAFKFHSTEGGIRCPCIVRYPSGIKHPPGSITHSFTNVVDIMPTVLELAGLRHPGKTFRGREVVPMRGKSWGNHLKQEQAFVYRHDFDFTGWELFGCRAVRKGDWKAILQPEPKGTGGWELYNLAKDPGEIDNQAELEPQKLKELIMHYEQYYQETGMFDANLAIQERRKLVQSLPRQQGDTSSDNAT